MISLANQLSCTTPVSLLVRKARRLDLHGIGSFIQLASTRGCRHYHNPKNPPIIDPGLTKLTNTELTILLISGENSYEPMAVRCAAQLARSSDINPTHLATLAIRKKADRVLHHIATAGSKHDILGKVFWDAVIDKLPNQATREEPHLPHWSRFVSIPGYQRGRTSKPTWLIPSP
ncbi:MAG: hypothetical protein HC845_14775 [Akkermansiaceae bacterium]|nr:hypothetical protein [Akkermansiaceae bacterium]